MLVSALRTLKTGRVAWVALTLSACSTLGGCGSNVGASAASSGSAGASGASGAGGASGSGGASGTAGASNPGCLASAGAACGPYPEGTVCPGSPNACVACWGGVFTLAPSTCTCTGGSWVCAPNHDVSCPNPGPSNYSDYQCKVAYAPGGASGASGASGTSGTSGTSGASGTSVASGLSEDGGAAGVSDAGDSDAASADADDASVNDAGTSAETGAGDMCPGVCAQSQLCAQSVATGQSVCAGPACGTSLVSADGAANESGGCPTGESCETVRFDPCPLAAPGQAQCNIAPITYQACVVLPDGTVGGDASADAGAD